LKFNLKYDKIIANREVIGYVTTGNFSYQLGYGFGIAYCSLKGAQKLIDASKLAKFHNYSYVLLRNISSQYYRIALLSSLK